MLPPFAREAYRRWLALPPEERERYERMVREPFERPRRGGSGNADPPLTGDAARYGWMGDGVDAATVAVLGTPAATAQELLEFLGQAHWQGTMTLAEAVELSFTHFNDTTAMIEPAVVQAERLPGREGEWWVAIEPNGWQLHEWLTELADGALGACLFWNINAFMQFAKTEAGELVHNFDPLLDMDAVPEEGRDLPFGTPGGVDAAAMALIERWTGVSITEAWFRGPKATFLVDLERPA